MPTARNAQEDEVSSPIRQDDDLRLAAIALVQDLSEPLTAIQNYLEAAVYLYEAEATDSVARLGDVFDKSRAVLARANTIVTELRDLLREEKAAPPDA